MKKLTILLWFVLFSFQLMAQTSVQSQQISLDKIQVTDSSGSIIGTELVKQLLNTGKYGIQWKVPMQSGILIRLTETQIKLRQEKLPKPPDSKYFKTGAKIQSFSEKDMGGEKFNLKDLASAGKVVVLNFWFINCPPCRMEIPQLNEMVASYQNNKDLVFIGIALDDKYALEKFLKTLPFDYHIIDNGRYIASQYGIISYPTHVVINKEGKVLFHTSGLGSGTVTWLRKSIDAALEGRMLE
jgi:thiol-disulfide isomerase/thioredoxin